MPRDLYAGDEAWRQWFCRCQVPLCDEEWRGALWEEIESALTSAIREKRIYNANLPQDYIRHYFDTYFQLRGTEAKDKPRKRQIESRIPEAQHGLRGVVLGTLMSGEVKTMAREIKIAADGGEAVWKRNPETGEKELVIVSLNAPRAGAEDGTAGTLEDTIAQAPALDVEADSAWYAECAADFLHQEAGENVREKNIAVAAMVFVVARKVPVYKPVVERLMGVKHVAAGNRIERMKVNLSKFCKKRGILPSEVEFFRSLGNLAESILERAGVLGDLKAARKKKEVAE